jgi:RNA polymerase sigma factor (sigma-70 family)
MKLRLLRPADRHEAWFEQHYADLVRWAAQITGGDRDQADDLVHDVFVHFMTSRLNLRAMTNADGYLYVALRNLHLSNVRRAARRHDTIVPLADFDLLDYDSLRAVHELQAIELREQFHHQLRAIWRYAHIRKRTSKTASVLMLRFFHGYYPEEIAQVLQVSREAADQLLRRARKEARAFIANPAATGYADGTTLAKAWPADGLLSPPDLAMALHKAALESDPEGVCLAGADLTALYAGVDRSARADRNAGADRTAGAERTADADPAVSAMALAHVVSCRDCLDRVTRHLGLPPLAERHPLDSLGYDRDTKPPHGGFGGGGSHAGGRSDAGGRSVSRRRPGGSRRRLSELLAQAPKELRVACNGIMVGSQQVTSSSNRLTFRLTGPAPDFVEIFSEQEVRLILVSLEAPPRGPAEVHEAVVLNDGRRLDVRVDFADAVPVIEVSYVDPAFAATPALTAAADVAITQPPSFPPSFPPPLMRRLRARALRLIRWRAGSEPFRWRLSRRGAFTTIVMATAIAAVLLNQLGRPVLSAAELLQQSSGRDAAWQTDHAHVVHRTVAMDVRSTRTGVTTRRRVEVWHSAARGLTVRRAYDDQNRLVAGAWIDVNGKQTVHRSEGLAEHEPALQGIEAWQLDPSAASFTRLVGDVDRAVVTTDANRFRVSFDSAATSFASARLSVSLTLREDRHALVQQATVRTAEGTTEFTWTEQDWVTTPAGIVPASVFDIDPSFIARVVPSPTTSIVPPATPNLEVAALTALRRIDADLGAEVRVRRFNGRLDVSGIVASRARQAQIRSVLAEIARDPAARVRIDTIDEAHTRARRSGVAARPLDPAAGSLPPTFGPAQIPAHQAIRRYLLATGVSAADADDDVAGVAYEILQRAERMRVHAWALRSLLDAIPAAEMDRLDARGRRQWRALVSGHGRGFAQEASSFAPLLAQMFPADAPPAASPVGGERLQDDDQIRRASLPFVDAATDAGRMLTTAVTLPVTGGGAAAPFDPQRFWIAFTRARTLAASLAALPVSPAEPITSSPLP